MFLKYLPVDAVRLHYWDITPSRTSTSVCIWGRPKQHHLCVHTDGENYFIHAWLLTEVGSHYSCEFEPIETFTHSSTAVHLCDAFGTLLGDVIARCCMLSSMWGTLSAKVATSLTRNRTVHYVTLLMAKMESIWTMARGIHWVWWKGGRLVGCGFVGFEVSLPRICG